MDRHHASNVDNAGSNPAVTTKMEGRSGWVSVADLKSEGPARRDGVQIDPPSSIFVAYVSFARCKRKEA